MTSGKRPFRSIAPYVHPREGGQVIALVAIGVTVILGMAAFAIDVGSWYQVKRQAQSAADAGATAAAGDLPSNPTTAVTDAQTYVNKNISGATTTVVTPYSSDSTRVEVTVHKNAPTYFAKIFGIGSVSVTARAVAKRAASNIHYAAFAASTSCSSQGITVPGSSQTISGAVRSNGPFSMPGSNNHLGQTTYGGPNRCTATVANNGNTFNGASSPTADYSNIAWPEAYFTSAPGAGVCTFTGSSYTFNIDGTATNPHVDTAGTYCATSSITVNGKYNTCRCTFIAPTVSLPGSNLTMTPYYQDLIIDHYSSGSDFNISASGDNLTGVIFVPFRRLGISGSSGSSYNLFLEGNTISISGSGWTLNGYGPSAGYASTQLTE